MTTATTEATGAAPSTASRTTLRVELAADRVRVGTRLDGDPSRPRLRPVILGTTAATARVALVPDGALLLAGDSVELVVEVGPGATLELQEPAGTVAYDMRGARASWSVDAVLGADAGLVWRGEPFVLASGADVRRDTRVRLGDGARLALLETLVLGRHGEPAGRLHQRTEVTRPDGSPVLVEELLLEEATVATLLGGHRVVGTILSLGTTPPGRARPGLFVLECGGHLVRRLVPAAHQAVDEEAWARAVAEVRSYP